MLPNPQQKQQKAFRVLDQNKNEYLPTFKSKEKFSEIVYFKKLHPNASLPTRGTEGSIGFDVLLPEAVTLQPNQITKIPTGLASSFPTSMYMRIADCSSLALKNLTVKGGVIDSDFRGDITIIVKNNTNVPITLTKDQKVAQFIFEKAEIPQIVLTEQLDTTERESGAFGSTDKKHHQSLHSNPSKHLQRLHISPSTTIIYSNNKRIKPIIINNSNGK